MDSARFTAYWRNDDAIAGRSAGYYRPLPESRFAGE